jgi:SAM-dependent MidA family methyltransferase
VPFSEVMEAALYDPDGGFYATGGIAGRRGDFLTSPEVGPLFGAVVARALDEWWVGAGRPDPFVVVEAGAGPGTLCRAVLAAAPACAPALRYVLVERSEVQRERHRVGLPLVEPAFAFAPAPDDGGEDPLHGEGAGALASDGPLVVSLGELPRWAGPAVVLANELLDNLPVDLLEWRAGGWHQVSAGLEHGTEGQDRLAEVLVPLADPPAAVARMLDGVIRGAGGGGLADGSRVPVPMAAGRWVRDLLELVRPPWGRLVVIDYGATTAVLAGRPAGEWLRTYRAHQRGTDPLDQLGTQDITCEVAWDQLTLAGARPPDHTGGQAGWLRAHGLDELVDAGRRLWEERAGVGDLAAVRARSRITEAEALTDPAGLGGFSVLEWVSPASAM